VSRRSPLLASITLAVLGLLPAGCALGPNYRPALDQQPVPARFVAAAPTVATPDPVVDDWWRLYHDPALDQLVQDALTANTDLRVASANLARAKAVLSEARDGLYTPQTQLSASASEARSPTANLLAALSGRKAHASGSEAAGFAASYEVDVFGRLRRGVEAARADAEASHAALDYARVAVAASTATAYAEACAYGAAVTAAQTSRDIARQTAEVTLARRNLGAASNLDVSRAQALAGQAAAAVPALEAQRRSVLFSLAVLTGRTPETVIPAAQSCRVAPHLDAPPAVGDAASLLRRRPDIREAERRLAGDTARIGVATAQLFPIISLGGQLAASGASFDKAVSYSGTSFSIGPGLSWTGPNILAARDRVRESSASARASLARLDGTVLQAYRDVETALANLTGARQQNAALRTARDQLRVAVDIARARNENGASSFLELLDAQRSLQQAENDLATSDLRQSDAEIALFRALGGGWKSAPAIQDPRREPAN
jgi:outer membrane protein, multidrug efflux system